MALVVQLLPARSFALGTSVSVDKTGVSDIIMTEDASGSIEEAAPAQVVGEDVSRRDEFYKEFVLSNGLRLASVYPEDVHYDHRWVNGKRQKELEPVSPDYNFSGNQNSSFWLGLAMTTVCTVGIVLVAVDNVTVVGAADDGLAVSLGAGIAEGIRMIFGK
jgi:hypothetical protein